MADEQVVSDEQLEANKQHKERKRWARQQHVAGPIANTLVESRTLRNPLIPQPEPDANPLVPLRFRPERSRNPENNIEGNPVGESRTGGEDAEHTENKDNKKPAPQPGPQVIDPLLPDESMTRDELNRVARENGIQDPEALHNKGDVIKAIEDARR